MALHKSVPIDQIHVPYTFIYANATARTSATNLLIDDIGKFARQLDNNTLWMLTNNSPVTWVGVSESEFNDTIHGSRSGGSLHSTATTSTAGFMAAADKTKLDGIPAGGGGGGDADTLDGQHGSYYTNASNLTGTLPSHAHSAADLTSGTLPAGRFDDTAHGSRSGGSLHSTATISSAGFMSATDKVNLDVLIAGGGGGGGGATLTAGTIALSSQLVVPSGYLLCNGQEVSKTQYPELYAQIGDSFGTPSISSNFVLPNLKGKVPIGVDSTDPDCNLIGESGGTKSITVLPEHDHDAVTTSIDGFMTSADKIKLDTIPSGSFSSISVQSAIAPYISWTSNSSVSVLANEDLMSGCAMLGFPNIHQPNSFVSAGLTDGLMRANTSTTTLSFPNDILYGTEKANQWYNVYATSSGNNFVLKASPMCRVGTQSGQTITFNNNLNNASIDYGFATNSMVGCKIYTITGLYKGSVRTISSNNSASITYSGTALTLTAGDWFVILPNTNFRFIGDILNNTNSNIWRFERRGVVFYWIQGAETGAQVGFTGVGTASSWDSYFFSPVWGTSVLAGEIIVPGSARSSDTDTKLVDSASHFMTVPTTPPKEGWPMFLYHYGDSAIGQLDVDFYHFSTRGMLFEGKIALYTREWTGLYSLGFVYPEGYL